MSIKIPHGFGCVENLSIGQDCRTAAACWFNFTEKSPFLQRFSIQLTLNLANPQKKRLN